MPRGASFPGGRAGHVKREPAMRLRFLVLAAVCAGAGLAAEPLRFRVTLDGSIAPQGASGRLFVFMEKTRWKRERVNFGILPEGQLGVAREVPSFAPGAAVELGGGENAWPKPLTEAAPGDYSLMALLDVDHSFSRNRQDPGDLYSEVLHVRDFHPYAAGGVELRLSKVTPPLRLETGLGIQLVEIPSKLVSAFSGQPAILRAAVVLPPNAPKGLPAVYHIHGFGG